MKKLMLKFWYWWYVVTPISEWQPDTDLQYQLTEVISTSHPKVINQFQNLVSSISNWWFCFQPFSPSVYQSLLKCNPFHKYKLIVSYEYDDSFYNDIIRNDKSKFDIYTDYISILLKNVGMSEPYTYDVEVEFYGTKYQIKKAIVIIDGLKNRIPELCQINEIDDADFLGIGY